MEKMDWLSVHSMTGETWEYDKLEGWASEMEEKFGEDQTFIEIGSYHGRSTTLLAQYAKIIACDYFGSIDGGPCFPSVAADHIQPFIRTMRKFDLLGKKVFPVISGSEVLNTLTPQNASLIFIDGDHSYEKCLLDLQRSHRHLRTGGYMVVHDMQREGPLYPAFSTKETDGQFGVSRAVHEYMDNNKDYELVEHYTGIICFCRR
jgi:predicted O-methyltransferase YrrM